MLQSKTDEEIQRLRWHQTISLKADLLERQSGGIEPDGPMQAGFDRLLWSAIYPQKTALKGRPCWANFSSGFS
ncbi:hypothetical protein CHELA40_14594 [Chelatococcus asaccharovorans]|nr:hypothetical protein CHELA17_61026 [Chelatococcus asaccharovorans]CAH1678623.1 hypothetical protein CHELA40_14594 [Chelatococcus asaccharovorans]